MNEAAAIRADIAVVIAATPAIVFTDPKKADELFVHIEHEIAAFVPDLTTDKGRKAVASLAYKIAQTKTAVDAAGKALNEDAKQKIDAVNAERSRFKARFEDLQTKARKPLDDWETKEQQRIDYMRRMLKHIEDCGNGTIGGQPQPFGVLFRELEEKIVIDDSLGEFKDEAIRAKSVAIDKLRAAQAAHDRAEADRAELERLRAAERERIEREAAAEAEADNLARAEAEKTAQAERERVADAAAARRAEQAAENARAEEKRRADEAVAKAEREKQAVIDAAARADREREAAAKRLADEQAARDADREHRRTVMGAVKAALMTHGAGEATAKKIVLAIVAGEIPNVTLRF